MEDNQEGEKLKNGLIYGLNDKPPFKEAFFAALQHLLAIFVAIITPPLIIAGALKLDAETTGYLVSMALFASGISTFIQCRRSEDWVRGYSASREPVFPLSDPLLLPERWAGFRLSSVPASQHLPWKCSSAGF